MSTRTLFIHIPKSSGTSIAASVPVLVPREQYVESSRVATARMDPRGYHLITNPQNMIKHTPYNYLDKSFLNSIDRAFAVVRNPWSRIVSLYNHGEVVSNRTAGTFYYQPKISFDEFLNRMNTFRMTPSYYWNHPYDQWGIQLDWIVKQNKVKSDILRYEYITSDLSKYFNADVDLKRENIGVYKDHYTEYYSDEQRKMVADWFRLDIEHFGFTFESGATRNYWTQ